VKVEGMLFALGAAFYTVVTLAYWFITHEIVGTTALTLTAALALLIGFYMLYTGSRVGVRPEDRNDGEIDEADPDYGFFSPHSWWPLPVALGAATTAVGLVFTAWLACLGVFILMFGVIGLVFEYYRVDHAH